MPEPRPCAGCGQPVEEFHFTEVVNGLTYHEGCAS